MSKCQSVKVKNIIIGSDHGGFKLKEKLKIFLEKKGFKVKDVGCFSEESCDYPTYAYEVSRLTALDKSSRGILICKSGIGNSIVANRIPGVRAALCYNLKAAKLSRQHNDANVLVLGSLFVKEKLAKRIVLVWLKTEFEGGRHLRRIKDIERLKDKI